MAKTDWDNLDDALLPVEVAVIIKANIKLIYAEIARIRKGTSTTGFPAVALGPRKTIIPKVALRIWLSKGGRL